ncbi:hypothetical protein IGS59_04170 [Janthinobacterium sp. GW460P]|uniref:hypothetical protein n=1 Tax=unclassified Janthinobacterium TaxID=2610881 RepID=UPI000A3202C9|nr:MULTISPECIES: hypothetical protein [unclassified Janthinobacterium]MCC7701424.1 hypothetical protein [Janthinobacterium sp. GW460P]MCC7706931.1 hypothetical protein [Janthinobacterium sp. GW460W]
MHLKVLKFFILRGGIEKFRFWPNSVIDYGYAGTIERDIFAKLIIPEYVTLSRPLKFEVASRLSAKRHDARPDIMMPKHKHVTTFGMGISLIVRGNPGRPFYSWTCILKNTS